jgi:phosphomannomutase / phosphoglucomutase
MDGNFPGRLPEPSPEGLLMLGELVRSTGAALGIAHDGDADRAVFLDEQGQFIEENREYALIAGQVCRERKGIVVAPVSTSRVIETIAHNNGCSVKYTRVGSIYVARAMRALEAEGKPVAFGGEGNGGLIYPDHQYCRDGGMTAAMMIAILARERCPVSELVATLPEFHLIKEKIRGKDPAAMIQRLNREFSGESIDRTDGIRINRPDSWALVRPSGTEPLVRVIVESQKKEIADEFFNEIMQKMGV